MWLAEMITERGIGNGSSFIIFSNIIAGLPTAIVGVYVFIYLFIYLFTYLFV